MSRSVTFLILLTALSTGCTSALDLLTAVPACGDGQVTGIKQCDDGNREPGDGCSSVCRVEQGWTCSGQPSHCSPMCGDGLVLGSEQCDDGNTTNGDGCSATCSLEPGWTCAGQPSMCTCASGFHACGNTCANNTSPLTCGASCMPCPVSPGAAATCNGLSCGYACNSGYLDCDGNASNGCECSSPENGAAVCSGSACRIACSSGHHMCGDVCVTNTAVSTCGASCTPCLVPANAEAATCDGSNCGFKCRSGYLDCDGEESNGCECGPGNGQQAACNGSRCSVLYY